MPDITSVREETANAMTHGIGVVLGLVITPVLMSMAVNRGHFPLLCGIGIFCFSLLLTYSTSTIYHSVWNARWRPFFQKLDHISIYFLIAGTHTPFLLLYLNDLRGILYLVLLWTLVLIGIVYKLFYFGRWKLFSVLFYLGLGWMAVFTIPPMLTVMGNSCLKWIIIGGLSYTVGVAFYLWERLPYHHTIWHLFVMGGSMGHTVALLYAITPD